MREDWHLDRKITVALIIGLLANAGTGAWWAATTSKRLEYVENAIMATSGVPNRVTVLETQGTFIQRDLAAANMKLDKLIDIQQERNAR